MTSLNFENTTVSSLRLADEARLLISPTLDPKQRSKMGQFMTPAPIASYMAGMFDSLPKDVRLLDAGSGVGSLIAAFVDHVIRLKDGPRSIDVTAFEVDPVLIRQLKETLAVCTEECENAGIVFTAQIIEQDYVLHSADVNQSDSPATYQFDCAILNPPYAKISSASKTRSALRSLGIETSNLYTAFVAVAILQLVPNGQLVAITPRSFCNGSYFEPFRRLMLGHTSLRKIHVYESRKQAFKDDDVLQENIIFKLIKTSSQSPTVEVSSSHSPKSDSVSERNVPFIEVVIPNDPHVFIRLPVSEADAALAHRVRALPCSLHDLGVSVSTGRVVGFRSRSFLRKNLEPGCIPLIYPVHFEAGFISWPKPGIKKYNAFVASDETSSLLVPSGIYVLAKRFTAKEEKRRVVAAIYDPSGIHFEQVGFENKLNYFHSNGAGLPSALARGLTLFLNSSATDQYFRQFSGHTQVNATDLRNLHYPTVKQLEKIGRSIGDKFPTQEKIDKIIEDLL